MFFLNGRLTKIYIERNLLSRILSEAYEAGLVFVSPRDNHNHNNHNNHPHTNLAAKLTGEGPSCYKIETMCCRLSSADKAPFKKEHSYRYSVNAE